MKYIKGYDAERKSNQNLQNIFLENRQLEYQILFSMYVFFSVSYLEEIFHSFLK